MHLTRLINYKIAKRKYLHMTNRKPLTETQASIVRIYRRLLFKPDSELLVAPLSGKKYLKWKDVTAIIAYGAIVIVNHKYYYSVDIPDDVAKRLIYHFDIQVEKKRTKMENELTANINSSLSSILHEIKSL